MVDSKKYERIKNKKGFLGAYVVDKHKTVVSSIAFTKPKDAHGREVSTSYKIEKNTIVQKVGFTKKTAFPVKMGRNNHPPRKIYQGKITKKEAIRIKKVLNAYKFAHTICVDVFFSAGNHKVIVIFATWLVGKKWEKLIEKYTTAIARVTKRKKRIKVYDIEYWRNGGKNSGYVTRDQELENVR